MKSIPLVSVCMITYNHGSYIKQAIESILAQKTNFIFEIVIAEDCSTDITRNICFDFHKRNPDKMHLILNEKNIGMMPNFVQALKACKGKYIALCEGDDYWTDSLKLQKQVDFLEANGEYSGVFHKTQQIFEPDGKLGSIYGEECKQILTTEDTFSTFSPFHTSSFVFKQNGLIYPDWFHNVTSGDMTIFSIISAQGSLYKIDQIMSVYRKHEGGITNTKDVQENYHQKRIELMNYLDGFHHYKYSKKAKSVIRYHKEALEAINNTRLYRLKNTLRRLISKPKWMQTNS